MYRPVASHAVAIHSTANWVWIVRLMVNGRMSPSGMPKKLWPSTE